MKRALGSANGADNPSRHAPGLRAPGGSGHRGRGPRGDHWVVVLAGGDGTRLRGFTRQVLGTDRPKQFCRIIGTRSMLRHTWDRAARLVPPERIVTIIIWEEDRFESHMRAAVGAAANLPPRVLLLGVEADGPETAYGYIAPGEPVEAGPAAGLYAVQQFWEKPDRLTAALLFARNYFWNTFVLTGGVDAFLDLAEAGVPETLTPLRAIAPCLGTPAEAAALVQAYKHLRATNLSRALLARHPEALLVLAARGISWCDWGDPERIIRSLRRFDRQPAWLPVYARTQAAMGPA